MSQKSTFSPQPDKVRSLYVHVPFCRHRCGYCNFSLVAGRDDLIDRYLDALTVEIGWLTHRPTVKTVFLGGGTPSHLSVPQFQRLVTMLRDAFDWSADIEVSIECNPNDLTADLARAYAQCGVNRFSFGVQSFNERKLELLERDHRAEDIFRAVELARTVTDNISFDLIFATSEESPSAWERDLESALALEPVHLSLYELTIEQGTPFWSRNRRGELPVPDEDARATLYQQAIDYVVGAGLHHYEISSFALPGRCCRHNLSYWNGDDYFAFGPGAARFVDGIRENNHRSTTTWLKLLAAGKSPVVERQNLTPLEIAIDRIVFGLRRITGFSLGQFTSDTGFDAVKLLGDTAGTLLEYSLIEIVEDHCRLTSTGVMLYDGIASRIMGEGANK